ncbi:ABC transporter ATP-binding protein [Sporolactobacillus nakayamae]|uniref:Carnitine transport ATP-binding protein OpuCA n=1 Tax=Sporolactobacillus nakayamae TaxID=269670 RepID=A0A1I2UCZ1_9BACL|nr:ABC transporter ATP-binding protein [Sporolactobacillus nakayamae]SFG74918.1 putative spermidine/putrescine transport system ATP-binding protein [Sporolactobacillus nakayamae]
MNYLEIQNLTQSYQNTQILKNLSINVEKGKFISLLGPSGCGKSTLLRSICGLIKTDSGKILVDGKDITNESVQQRNIGMVFQSYALFPNMTVYENIAFGLKVKKLKANEIKKKVMYYLDLVSLTGKENRYPNELSGGQQQRVALARAIVTQPKILLLDEPLSALDAQIRRRLRNQIRELQQKLKITVLFVTHDQEEAIAISDHIFVMNNGKFEQSDTPENLYLRPKTKFVASFIGHYNVVSDQQLTQIVSDTNQIGKANFYAIRPEAFMTHPVPDTECYTVKGVIENKKITGNTIRYAIDVQNVPLTFEVLHQQESHTEPGQGATLYLRRSDILPLTN